MLTLLYVEVVEEIMVLPKQVIRWETSLVKENMEFLYLKAFSKLYVSVVIDVILIHDFLTSSFHSFSNCCMTMMTPKKRHM